MALIKDAEPGSASLGEFEGMGHHARHHLVGGIDHFPEKLADRKAFSAGPMPVARTCA
ncbi:hypothetical protein SBA_pBAR3_1480 (plasmid) [Sphingomonas bisphenolicum]|uniref:Uncharacterized protein n=1 Tax=Sphingomonas bisphenolicum TaxID=296544 RepID=A0ABM7G8V4_9SPHN|nr:hypothetical protein SBA_pBAR3_1480 [Sphingomonas bisphenolicum]